MTVAEIIIRKSQFVSVSLVVKFGFLKNVRPKIKFKYITYFSKVPSHFAVGMI